VNSQVLSTVGLALNLAGAILVAVEALSWATRAYRVINPKIRIVDTTPPPPFPVHLMVIFLFVMIAGLMSLTVLRT